MNITPRFKPPAYQRSDELQQTLDWWAQRMTPGRTSSRIQRLFQQQAGRSERTAVNRLKRMADHPLIVKEGIEDINEGTALAAGENAIRSELAEEQVSQQAANARTPILMAEDQYNNQANLMKAQADHQGKLADLQLLTDLLGFAGQFALGGWENAAIMEAWQQMYGGGGAV